MKLFSKLFFLSVILISFSAKSQTCGTCSINITSLDSASYTINTGETFCVDTTGIFQGTIILSGGTICNKGLFLPKILTFNSGVINNYSNVSIKSNISFTATSQLSNNGGGTINISGNLTNSGGTLNNDGIINVSQSVLNNSGSLANTNIINCQALSGAGTLNNTGVINQN